MPVAGGLRTRLIRDSTFNHVRAGLAALGWFDPTVSQGGVRQHLPITATTATFAPGVEVPLNTLAVTGEGRTGTDAELGTTMPRKTQVMLVDFYAESDDLGEHVIGDVESILLGEMPDLGYGEPAVPVYDYSQAPDGSGHWPLAFWVEVIDVRVDRAHNFPEPFLQHWFSVMARLEDNP